MANTSRINGFRPVKHVTGAPYNGQANLYATASVDATPLFVGDPVVLLGDGHTVSGVPTIARAAGGAAVLGVVVGFVNAKQDPVTGAMTAGSIILDTPVYRAPNVVQYVLVADAPDIIYEVEVVTSGGGAYAYASANTGLNADAYFTNGSTTTGVSGCALNANSLAATATLQFKVLGPVPRVDNAPTGSSTKVWVKINNATMGGGTGATGQ